MLETMGPAGLKWILALATQHPEIFGDHVRDASAFEEPQVASHRTCIYGVNGARIHVKFFGRTLGRTSVTYDPAREMVAEYGVLKEFERNGFSAGRHRIVRALGYNEALDCALATVYSGGETVLAIIYDVIREGRPEEDLFGALDLTAGLLRKIHTLMPRGGRVDGADTFYSYLKAILYLEEQNALDGFHRRITKGLSRWYNHKPLFEQEGVTIHGDANPSNFKVGGDSIYGFDVERSRPGRSPLLDAGMMVAELLHHFSYLTGNAGNAGPFVERFLGTYFGDDRRGLELLPFYVSRSFLKIAMLGYWKRDYKRYLIEQGARYIEVAP